MCIEPTISKSQYIKGKQCPLALWYYRNKNDLEPEIKTSTQIRFDVGHDVGLLAQEYFSGGVGIDPNILDIPKSVEVTNQLIADGYEIIYEATAIHPSNGLYSSIDVLRKAPNCDKWDLIEVKSSTSKKEYHVDDMAFQYYVFSNAGYEINSCYLMTINNDYLLKGKVDPAKLFKFECISEDVLMAIDTVHSKSKELVAVTYKEKEPKVKIGSKCFKPFECEYRFHCWRNVPNFSIYGIYPTKKADQVFKKTKSFNVEDIPSNLLPNTHKAIDIECYKNQTTHVEKDKLNRFLDQLKYPLFYLDYETLMNAIPLYEYTRPYQQIPFQFSLHIQNEQDEDIEHFDFLHKDKTDPRPQFIKRLLELCGKSGSIIVYNQSFEISRNKELARDFPEFSEELEALNSRVIDLMEPFQRRWLYKSEQSGSHSIKNVLPAHVPELSYDGMNIANGEDAMNSYIQFLKGTLSDVKVNSLWGDLSRYCEMDTYAMVRLLDTLRQYAG